MTDKIGYTRKGDIAVLRISNPPVNALSHAVREGLVAGMDRAEADDGVKAVVIVGDGRAFIAGADITEFGKTPLEPFLPDLCKRIEDSPLIVVASLHGVSLGGGLEVALSAHYRIAQPSAKVGLPEVHLGLIPGAGGTQRLPRLIGVDAALDLITTGRQVKADEADRLGIIDEITEGDPGEVGLAYAEKLVASNAPRRPISEMEAPDPIDWDAAYDGTLKKGRGQISPAQAVRAVQASVELPFHQGMQAEREIFMDLMRTDQRQGMIHAFFSERAVGNLPELKGVEPRALQSIGIIGGGTMGAGIATAALLAGFNVVLIEMKLDAAEAARARISGNLSGALKRGKISELQFKTLTTVALEVSINYDSLASVDLVIEAVFEDMAVKKDVFGKLDAVCKPDAILASNTSYLDINEIAASTSRPESVIGLHFFSPAHVMKLLEVVVAERTAPDVVATGFALGKALNKISVRAGVCDGFIGNRILATYRTAADHMVLDGASPYQIDKALVDFGFAMGPFAVADLAGLEHVLVVKPAALLLAIGFETIGSHKVRMQAVDIFGAFDCPDAGQMKPRRTRSITPVQSLSLLNSPFANRQAAFFAGRVRREAGNGAAAQINLAFRLACARAPKPSEQQALQQLATEHGLEQACRVLFNSSAFLYLQ